MSSRRHGYTQTVSLLVIILIALSFVKSNPVNGASDNPLTSSTDYYLSYGIPEYSKPVYNDFLKFISNETFNIYPVCEYNTSKKPDRINVILRHDLDFDNGYEMAKLEQKCNIRSTYYLRLHSHAYNINYILPFYQNLEPKGYEIGYHYEVVDLYLKLGNETVKKKFNEELEYLRKYFNIRSVASHGGAHNYQFERWTNVSQYNVISAYNKKLLGYSIYLSDASREFMSRRLKLDYFREGLKNLTLGQVAQILIHPDHWGYRIDAEKPIPEPSPTPTPTPTPTITPSLSSSSPTPTKTQEKELSSKPPIIFPFILYLSIMAVTLITVSMWYIKKSRLHTK